MARLMSCGFELNSTSKETFTNTNSQGTIVTSPVRTGTYAGHSPFLGSTSPGGFVFQLLSSATTVSWYLRAYLYIEAYPAGTQPFIAITTGASSATTSPHIRLSTTGTLQLFNGTASVGSATSALNLGQWYRIEMHIDSTQSAGSQILEAKLDGTNFASASNLTLQATTFTNTIFGANTRGVASSAVGSWDYDDIAINDSSGSFQNTYPGSGGIIHLNPNATGDSNGYLVTNGGTAGASNNFTRVNEVTPNDATTYNASVLLNAEDLYNCADSGIGSGDTVNVVSVGGRFADLVAADATTAFKFEIEKTVSGTKSQSSAIIANSTGWGTNTSASVAPQIYPITTYQDPDGAAWTQTTVDSAQIGMIVSATGVRTVAISTVWMLVDYTPSAGGTTPHNLSLLGVGS